MEIKVNEYLTWERAEQAGTAAEPMPCANHFPEWWKNLRGDLRNYIPASGSHRNHTARLCHGLRGVSQLGYTVLLDADLHTGVTQGSWRYSRLLQEMLHGSPWAEKVNDEFVWDRPMILAWPWRARMAPGWRLLMSNYPLEWPQDFHCFSGYVEANHGSGFWGWSQPMDPAFNYYNVETVVIMKPGACIPSGSAVFSMIPTFDPDYVPKPYGPYPF